MTTTTTATMMSPQDLQICHEIHAGLTSKERNNINYIFLEPVDVEFCPDYLSIISRPMDLRTLKENLDQGLYPTKKEFCDDAALIFENAILYNKERESKWVLKLAESMIKALERLRRNAEKRVAKQLGTKTAKAGKTAGSNGGETLAQKASKDGSLTAEAVASTAGEEKVKKKKISIKLKRKNVPSETTDAATSTSEGGKECNATADIENPKSSKKAKTKLRLSASSAGKSDSVVRGDESSSANNSSVKATTKVKHADSKSSFESTPMNSARRAQCCKILASLKRRQAAACKFFHKPVSDPAIVKNYKERILNPMDLSTISSRQVLDKNQYSTIDEFVNDLRLIAANCLQFNSNIFDSMKNDDSCRAIAVNFLDTSEKLCHFFLVQHEVSSTSSSSSSSSSSSTRVNNVYPALLDCWIDCVKVIDEMIQVTNPLDGLQTAWFFMEPVSYYCGGLFPEGYLEKIKKPMDFGTITHNLVTGRYSSVMKFASDCKQVVDNCRTFYAGNEEGAALCEQANRLLTCIMKHLTPLLEAEKKNRSSTFTPKQAMTIKRPKKEFLKEVMRELRATTYTDKTVKITENATIHFEKPVDTTVFTDYRQFVETPMDLETVDRKIESGSYATPEDFEYDVSLIWKNCDRYNGPKKNYHMVNLGKHTAKIFRKMFAEKMRGGSPAKRPVLPIASNKVAVTAVGGKKRPASPSLEEQPAKRVSIKAPSKTASKSVSNSIGKAASKSKMMSKHNPPKAQSKITYADNKAPLHIHVAISLIKESYPGRRQLKDLEPWEKECVNLLRNLMKHQWISAEKPKYIFHVPVHFVFPEIRDSYAAKIKQPMDLTTAEAKLLQGVYQDAEEFISDIALVFSNAIEFNKEGRDAGEPMSCAYHEASTHLLKYTRWLSLDVLQPFLSTCSDSPVVESGSASSWKLTVQNRAMARKEMESIVLAEHLDKTEPRENLSWRENECLKLMKSLRHMSDAKHMGFFISQQNLPPDYTTFISKPMTWDMCKNNLDGRKYNTFGEVIADLRLIFSNALKYNAGARHSSTVSGLAYESAIYMSGKLEVAIDKLLLVVADRLGRERIDVITSHREMEALERAQEEQRRLKWEQDNPGSKEVVRTTLRIVNQNKSHRRNFSQFELPFYDEGDSQEDQADDLQHAKILYEKQRRAHANVEEIALSIGITVFRRLEERAAAKAAAHMEQLERMRIEKGRMRAIEDKSTNKNPGKTKGEFVSEILNDCNRKQIKLSIQQQQQQSRKVKRSKRPILWMVDA